MDCHCGLRVGVGGHWTGKLEAGRAHGCSLDKKCMCEQGEKIIGSVVSYRSPKMCQYKENA